MPGAEDAEAGGPTHGCSELLRSSRPFSLEDVRAHLPFDLSNAVYLEVHSNDMPLFSYMLRFVSRQVKDATSIRADMGSDALGAGLLGSPDIDEIDEVLSLLKGKGKGNIRKRKREVKMPLANIGLGWHSFKFDYTEGSANIVALLQRIGEPSGDVPSFFCSLVVFVEGSDQKPLLKLCQQATEAATQQKEHRVSLWRYDTKHNFWMNTARRLARSLDSIVLEEAVKKPLLQDVEWFVQDDTRAFYAKHGIPYHRCYLFHGEPGTGKTSFTYSLAGHLQRNLCFLQMDKYMTDDTFRNAMSKLPSSAMVVLEDVDALFSNHREVDHNLSSLSFSGFLNCLDGLGAPDDVVICMTTNYPDKLDPAVTRPGRIDMKVAFKTPSRDVAGKYFLTFYPGAEQAAATFGASVGSRIAEKKVSMAQLQHFFLACHRLQFGAEKAAQYINEFTFEDHVSTSSWSRSYG